MQRREAMIKQAANSEEKQAAQAMTTKRKAKAKAKAGEETAKTRLVKARAAIAGEAPAGINAIWLKTAPRRRTMLSSSLSRVWKTPKEKEDHAEIRQRLKELGICLNLAKEDVDS